MKLQYATYEDAKKSFNHRERWEVFERGKEHLNIGYECVDRHPKGKIAIRLQFENGRREIYTYGELSRLSSQFANLLESYGIEKGDRVAVVLHPSLEFYVSFFGILKRGAVVVPCSPLFGPEAIDLRVKNSNAKIVIVNHDKVEMVKNEISKNVLIAEKLKNMLKTFDSHYEPNTDADTLAAIQFSSGTTGSPRPVYYNHSAASHAAVSMKLHLDLQDDDRFFCPSSPAWGHGIWYGTVGPLVFGNSIGAYSGKFNIERILEALDNFEITIMSATPLVYRSMITCGKIDNYNLKLRLLSFSGAPVDMNTLQYFQNKLGIPLRSYAGSTEVGVVMLDYGYSDYRVKLGSMGTSMFGVKVGVIDENGKELPPGQIGHLAVWRRDQWIKVGDYAYVDEDGYFWHKGRIDDVIISAGYTIGPFEIEEVLEKHPGIQKAAIVGSPDQERGEIVKAFIVPKGEPGDKLMRDIQEFIKKQLSKHEYPREIEFVSELPETPDGKIKRKELKFKEYQKKGLQLTTSA